MVYSTTLYRKIVFSLVILVVLAALVATPVAAKAQGPEKATVSLSATTVRPGDPLVLTIDGLQDGSYVSLFVICKPKKVESEGWYAIRDLTVPFSLNSGKFSIRGFNTQTLNMEVQKDGATYGISDESESGMIAINQLLDPTKGTYESIHAAYDVVSQKRVTSISFLLQGNVAEADPGMTYQIPFIVDSSGQGDHVWVVFYVNGEWYRWNVNVQKDHSQ